MVIGQLLLMKRCVYLRAWVCLLSVHPYRSQLLIVSTHGDWTFAAHERCVYHLQ